MDTQKILTTEPPRQESTPRMFDMSVTRLPGAVDCWSYTLRTDVGSWLGQVVMTSDGFFAAVTDYGNMAFAWRAFGQDRGVDFRDFILKIGPDYFASKMALGAAYSFGTSKKNRSACEQFTMMILPALKDTLRAERAA